MAENTSILTAQQTFGADPVAGVGLMADDARQAARGLARAPRAWKDRALNADAFVTFSLKPDGSIGEMRMQPVSPLTDFSYNFQDLRFTPVKEDAPGKVARPVH